MLLDWESSWIVQLLKGSTAYIARPELKGKSTAPINAECKVVTVEKMTDKI